MWIDQEKCSYHTFMKVSYEVSGGGKSLQTQLGLGNKTKFKFVNATYNIQTMRTNKHPEELEEKPTLIKFNIIGLSETNVPGEKCILLKSKYLLYRNNKDRALHTGETSNILSPK